MKLALLSFLIGLGLLVYAVRVYSQEQEFYYTVAREDSFDFKGIQFFHLKSANGSATVTVDGDVALADALKALDGKRVRLTLEPATLVLRKVER